MKRISAFVIVCIPLFVHAQGDGIHHFIAEGTLSEHVVKVAHASVISLDPQAVLSFDDQHLKVMSKTHTSAEVLQALNGGSTIHYRMEIPVERLGGGSLPDFPVRIDTGDAVGDDARYQQAKQEWISSNPQLYQEMIQPTGTVPLEPQER